MTLSTTYAVSPLDVDLEEASLPFTVPDSMDELSPQVSVRDPESINYVSAEAWKSFRIAQAKSKSTLQDLSMFPAMQLDIVLEILGYLHPLELLQLSRTNKAFRELLHAPITELIWRNSFLIENDPDFAAADSVDPVSAPHELPQCPTQMSGLRWAKFLFGPRICQECGQSGADADHLLLHRVCFSCLEKNLEDVVPGYPVNHEIQTAFHRTYRGIGDEDDEEYPERSGFWRTDGPAVVAQYEACVANGGAEAALCFIEERRELVSKDCDFAMKCDHWALKIRNKYKEEYSEKYDRMTKSVVKRLISEGFDERDVRAFYHIDECDILWRMPRLTSKLWHRARPYIVVHIMEARTRRLEREREVRVKRRKQVIRAVALMALRTPVPGLRHAYYPPPHTFDAFPPLAQLINEDSDEPLTHDDPRLLAAIAEAAGFVDAWVGETQAHMVSLLPNSPPEPGNSFSLLGRATSVFRVTVWPDLWGAVIGWDEARAHLHCFPEVHLHHDILVEFNTRGSAVAAELAVLLGLDPETATAAEMDTAEARFVCSVCPPESQGRWRPLTWRDCVVHGNTTHGPPSWTLLSPLAAADVRRREETGNYSHAQVWSCTLCNVYLLSLGYYKYVKEHIVLRHAIAQPIDGEHLIHFKGAESPQRKPVFLAVEGAHPSRFRCNRCAQDAPQVVQLFPKRVLRAHVRDRHLAELSDDDWTEVELLMPPVAAR
ncbi:hypothetical protein DFH08DRAFT_1084570 [Mycena albidolilacea]|uniref:F-box domain-containing protein n=1 Tax=Mycena albidolilacea TaxID=1033008 RepID=A0AAD6ZKW6_9AGAR|nr:hypothetical protein DFH08DRAFT_1084570 [Mycena albidolilacea]